MAADLPPLIGTSRAFLDLLDQVSRVAPLDRPVLVVGERGTGKELIASRIHYLSRRWDQSLVQLNCGALPESLLESELFGHEAGAFTGAVRKRSGRFELADGGTLFLDELANASLQIQEKILRVAEYGEFERVGGDRGLRVDVRIVGATNVDLPTEADAGRFRYDLLDRLSFEVLTIPPLRSRRDDVPLLADFFGRRMAAELGWVGFPGFAKTAVAVLNDHGWPGNVRELRNVVERAVYRHDSPTRPVDTLAIDPFESPYRVAATARKPETNEPAESTVAPPAPVLDGPMDFRQAVEQHSRQLLSGALEANRYNRRATAQWLGLSYDQLRNQLRKHGLND